MAQNQLTEGIFFDILCLVNVRKKQKALKTKKSMSIEYTIVHMQYGGDPIYMGIAHRSMWHHFQRLFF